jgi:FixJ family two-component response regulator
MRTRIAAVGDSADAQSATGMLIRRCGFDVWVPADPGELLAGPLGAQTLCLFIDRPGKAGLWALEALRERGVLHPALLVADETDELPAARVDAAGVLAMLARPVNPRELLSWLECLCVAQKYSRARIARSGKLAA